MNNENLSHTIYRDQDIQGQPTASCLLRIADDDRTERFEVLLRLMLVVCIGAAMLVCVAPARDIAPTTGDAAQCVPVVPPARVAVAAAAVPVAQNL